MREREGWSINGDNLFSKTGKADDTAEFVLKDDATNTTCALLNATMQIVLGNNKTNVILLDMYLMFYIPLN